MNWLDAESLTENENDSFFVFDEQKFRSNFQRLKLAFSRHYPKTVISYSYKTNYTPEICKIVDELGGYAEVVSGMEYWLAKRVGVDARHIIYNGPYKSYESFAAAAFGGSTINLDSHRDLSNLQRVAAINETGTTINVAVRCNFAVDETISRFGFDVESDEFPRTLHAIRSTPHVNLVGLHCHFPNRDLQSYEVRVRNLLKLTRQTFEQPPAYLSIGGGFFGEMPKSLESAFKVPPASFEEYGELVGKLFAEEFGTESNAPTLFIEPGTALVANTFEFYTKVVASKTIRGKNIAIVAGSIFNISPTARSKNLPVEILANPQRESRPVRNFDIAGFTCIEGDYLSLGLAGDLEVGDFLKYKNVGSYSIVMKPPFILPNSAIYMKSSKDGTLKLVKKAESSEYIFQNFEF